MAMRIKDGVVRDKTIRFRVSAEEEAALNKAVSETRFSREQYLRFIIQMKTPKLRPPADFGGVLRELSRISLSLQDMLKAKPPGPAERKDILSFRDEVDELIHSLIEEVSH